MRELINGNLPDILPEDVGYRCRVLGIDDSVVIHYTDQHGEHRGEIVAESLSDSKTQATALVVEAMCHAINAGLQAVDLLSIASKVYNFTEVATFPADGWTPRGLEKTLRVRYIYEHNDTAECVIIAPDERTTRIGKLKPTR
jgi:hypothetical protein